MNMHDCFDLSFNTLHVPLAALKVMPTSLL